MSNDSPSRGPRTAAPAPMGSTVAIVVTAVPLFVHAMIRRIFCGHLVIIVISRGNWLVLVLAIDRKSTRLNSSHT